jgi:hypothetical protein
MNTFVYWQNGFRTMMEWIEGMENHFEWEGISET